MARKKTLFIPRIAAAVLVSSSAVFAAEKTFLSIATGGTSGTYYPIGGAIAQAVSKGGVVQATAETSNASVANVNLVATKEIEIAFVQNDITFWAYTGEMMFKSPQLNLRAIAALYPEHVQLITTKNSGIKVIDDLKGKRVGVGAPGSGTEGDVRAIMQVAGLSYDDMKTDFLDFGATTSRFKDNQIDAGFVVAGFPTASVMDLATTKDITLLNFTPEYLDKLVKEFPYFIKSSVPGGTYMASTTTLRLPRSWPSSSPTTRFLKMSCTSSRSQCLTISPIFTPPTQRARR